MGVLAAKTVADALEPKGIYDLVIDLNQLPYLDAKESQSVSSSFHCFCASRELRRALQPLGIASSIGCGESFSCQDMVPYLLIETSYPVRLERGRHSLRQSQLDLVPHRQAYAHRSGWWTRRLLPRLSPVNSSLEEPNTKLIASPCADAKGRGEGVRRAAYCWGHCSQRT